MPQLTCSDCIKLTQRITELELRIDTLHEIKVIEKDIVFLGRTLTDGNTADLADTEVWSADDNTETQAESVAPPAPITQEERWNIEGAKPKPQLNSTPAPWSTVPLRRGASRPSRDSGFGLPLKNKYSPLEQDFPPLRRDSPPRSRRRGDTAKAHPCGDQLYASTSPHRCSEAHALAAQDGLCRGLRASARRRLVQEAALRSRGLPHTSSSVGRRERETGGAQLRKGRSPMDPNAVPSVDCTPPSVLVLGTSMIRHVRVMNAVTSCHPGALVLDIKDSAPALLDFYPSISTVVLHAGTNDLKLEQSVKLEEDFVSLISSVKGKNKHCIVSGPFSPPRFGNMKYSRLRSLHIFLKKYCMDNQIPYVDNFLLFRCPDLFKKDNLHPNAFGSKLLSNNIELTLESAYCKSD